MTKSHAMPFGTLPERLLAQVSELIADRLGLDFPRQRWPGLERGIRAALQEFGFDEFEAGITWLLSSPLAPSQIAIIARHLTVGETYFFRDKSQFDLLESHVLPEIIRTRHAGGRHLRLWSAGCCTGEEPYSLAILLDRLLPGVEAWPVTILATDVNRRFLSQAAEGVYGDWSFRNVPPGIKKRYFRRIRLGRFEIVPRVRRMVTFAYLNLADDGYPASLNNTEAMDLILCRNVLMYLTPECAAAVALKLHRSLVPGGWLVVSPSETAPTLFSPFTAVHFAGATLYQRGAAQAGSHPPAENQPEPDYLLPAPAVETVNKDEAPALHDEALALFPSGRYREAVAGATAIVSTQPDDTSDPLLLARAYANQGRLDEALAWCDRAIVADKINLASRYLRAMILQEQERPDEAAAALQCVLYLDPDFILAHFGLGDLCRRQGRLAEAGRHWRNALALLAACQPEEVLPESGGVTASRLAEIVQDQQLRVKS